MTIVSRLTEWSLLPMRSFLVPTFEQDLIRISDVRLNGFDQPINRICHSIKKIGMSESDLSSIQVLGLGLGFGEVPPRFEKFTTLFRIQLSLFSFYNQKNQRKHKYRNICLFSFTKNFGVLAALPFKSFSHYGFMK